MGSTHRRPTGRPRPRRRRRGAASSSASSSSSSSSRSGGSSFAVLLIVAALLFAAAARAGILDGLFKSRRRTGEGAAPSESTAEVDGGAPGAEEPACAAGDDDASCPAPDVAVDEPAHATEQRGKPPEAYAADAGRPSEATAEEEEGGEGEGFACVDLADDCLARSRTGVYSRELGRMGPGCVVNAAYMSNYCAATCGTCDHFALGHRLSATLEGGLAVVPFCQDHNFDCRGYADAGECAKNPEYMT